MLKKNQKFAARGVLVTLLLALSMVLTSAAQGTTARTSANRSTAAAAPVSSTKAGTLTSTVSGKTADGRRVTGKFIPLKFTSYTNKINVQGLISGVIRNADGTTETFSVLRTMKVQSINGKPITTATTSLSKSGAGASALADCDILNLNLAPLDLDLLGLQIHLDRVVLNIVAAAGAGNLLGNLLCAVAGLLDGGLAGLLGRLGDLLNQILGQLGLGL